MKKKFLTRQKVIRKRKSITGRNADSVNSDRSPPDSRGEGRTLF